MKEGSKEPDIFLLIKGLSSSDKSYYRKLAKRHANKNQALHLKLFKLIEKSEVYDEDKLRKALGVDHKVHFSEIKAYLYKDILDITVFQKRNISVDTRLFFMMEQIKTLQEKNLLFIAQKLCKKAIMLASQYEKYHYLVSLLSLQKKIFEFQNYKQHTLAADSIFNSMQAAIISQNHFEQNKFLYEQIRMQTYSNWLPITESELIEIKKKKIILDNIRPSANKEPIIYLFHLNSLVLCQYMLHENKNCSNTCQEIIDLWSAAPHLINEYAPLFLNSINVTCYNNFAGRDISQAEDNMAAYHKLMDTHLKNEYYLKNFEIIEFNTRLKLYHKTAQYEQVKTLIDKQVASILSYAKSLLSPPDELSILGSICVSYFVLEQWDNAEALLANIKEKNREINREDILYFSLLFYLAILYEKQEWYRLDIAIEATYHFLYTRKKLYPFEKGLILFLKRLPAFHDRKKLNEYISHFLKRLNALNISDKQLHFLYFNYYGWLESKVKGIHYMDYMSQQIANEKQPFVGKK